MFRALAAMAVLASPVLPGSASAQEGEKFDCVVASVSSETRASIGDAIAAGGDETTSEALFKDLAAVTDACAARHGIVAEQKGIYFEYSLARILREWLAADIGKFDLAPAVVDKALDFGPGGANPDLSGDLTEAQVKQIVQAYIENGVDIDKIDGAVWEKVGSYASATSIYWNKRKLLAF